MSIHICPTCGAQGKVTFSSTGERIAHLASCGRADCPPTVAAARFAALIPAATRHETIVAFPETKPLKPETTGLGVVAAVRCAIWYGTTVPGADVDDWLLYTHWSNRMVVGTAERTHDRTDFTIMRLCNHYDPRTRLYYRSGLR